MATNELRNDFRPPFAGILQILRATGYNFLSSILELVDNSISKDASNIRILLYEDRICVVDDATGMNLVQLCDAFVIANTKDSRDATDIGKFHVGMKSAIMNMGNTIVILSKVVGGAIVGIMVDIEVMKDNNSYNPTEIVANVTADWGISHGIKADLFAQFASQDSGTLIHVRHLLPKCSMSYDIAKTQLMKGIAISYSDLRPDCKIWIGNNIPGDELPLVDLFYSKEEVIGSPDKPTENLDFAPYETILNVYAPESKNMPPRIIEINTTKRNISAKTKTSGMLERPAYYEYSVLQKRGQKHSNIHEIVALPKTKLLGAIPIRVIQVKASVLIEEDTKVDGSLITDRKGFYFKRGVRTVGVAKRLGKKVHDRTSNAVERQRMLVEFPSDLDDVIGSKFNKQMDDQALPSQELTDALYSIYKQVTAPWVEKTIKLEAAEAVRTDTKSETSEHSVAVMLKRKSKKSEQERISEEDNNAEDLSETNEIIHAQPSEADEQPEADKQPEADEKPEADEQPEADKQPEADEQSEADEQPEADKQPEADEQSEADEQPEADEQSEADEQPEADKQPEGDKQPEADKQSEADILQYFGATQTIIPKENTESAPATNSPTFSVENTTDGCLLKHHNISIKVTQSNITLLDWLNTLTLEKVTALSNIL